MVRNGEFGMEDVKRVIHKYWWVVPVCIAVFGALGASVATLLPKKYTSQTMVLVAKPTVHHRLGSVFLRRSEEHTSELQSLTNLVCRLLLEKKKQIPSLRSGVH